MRRLTESPVAWQNASTAANAAGTLLQLLLIPLCLNPSEQGLFYGFVAFLAIQTFFELGMSHAAVKEVASLSAAKSNEVDADRRAIADAEIVRSIKAINALYLFLAASSTAILIPAGIHYFSNAADGHAAAWHWQWAAAAATSGLSMLIIGRQSVIEGRGDVLLAAKARTATSLARQAGVCTSLMLGLGIWSVAIGAGLSYLAHLLVARSTLQRQHNNEVIPPAALWAWFTKNWAFNWRIGISAISGFFIFQYITLVFASTQGIETAGRIGLGIQIANAPLWFASPLVSTKRFAWITLIENNNRQELDSSWRRATTLAMWATLGLSTLVFITVAAVHTADHPTITAFARKLPTPTELALLLTISSLNQYMFSAAQYLRCHGQEPFYVLSASFALILAAGLPLVSSHGTTEALAFYCITSLATSVIGHLILTRFQRNPPCHS